MLFHLTRFYKKKEDTDSVSFTLNLVTFLIAVDGNWGPWSVWSFGNSTCGFGGTKSRTRECDSPAPLYGGRPCDGDSLEHAEVELPPCR